MKKYYLEFQVNRFACSWKLRDSSHMFFDYAAAFYGTVISWIKIKVV